MIALILAAAIGGFVGAVLERRSHRRSDVELLSEVTAALRRLRQEVAALPGLVLSQTTERAAPPIARATEPSYAVTNAAAMRR